MYMKETLCDYSQCCRQDGSSIGNLFRTPSVRGPPNSAELIQTRSSESCSSFTSLSVRGSFHCIVDFKSACFFASCMPLMQMSTELMYTLYLTWLLHGLLGHVILFWNHWTKTATLSYVCMLYACTKKETQKSQQHTIEHVKSQNFLEPSPQTP